MISAWGNKVDYPQIQVYGSVVANRYSHQQILPLGQMSVSSDCFYQPRVDADFISETEQENLGENNWIYLCFYRVMWYIQ